MISSKIRVCLFAGLLVCCFGVSESFGNLIVNGDFEAGNTGFTSDFAFAPLISGAGTYQVLDDPNSSHSSATSYGDHTTGAGLMLAANGSTSGDTVLWSQTVSVLAGTDYDFSIFTSTWFSNAGLQLVINNVNVGSMFSTPTTNGVWEETTRTWNSGASTSAVLELINTTTGFAGNDFAIDDISFVGRNTPVIPEPTSMILFATGSVAMLLRRRSLNA